MNDYSTTIRAFDASIEEAIAAMSREGDRFIAIEASEATFAKNLIAGLARLLTVEPVAQRAVEALHLVDYSPWGREYDNTTPGAQWLMNVYNIVVGFIRRAAAVALMDGSVSEYLLAHANDPSVWHALKTANAPNHLLNRVLLARPGAVEQRVGARRLLFLGGGTKVVVDGSVWYGPVTPDVPASAGVQRGGEGPRFLLYRQIHHLTRPLAQGDRI